MKNKITKNIIFHLLFIAVLAVNELSFVYTEHLNRLFSTFLMIRYYDGNLKPNYTYMSSFVVTYLAVTIYSIENKITFIVAVLFYALSILIYTKLVFNQIKFTKKNWVQFLLFIVLFLSVPIYLTYKIVEPLQYVVMVIYAVSILLFFYSTLLLKKAKKAHSNFAIMASFIYLVSTFFTAIELFNIGGIISTLIATTLFWISHLFMNIYMTSLSAEKIA